MTSFSEKNASRDDGAPTNLYVFKGSDQAEVALERLVSSVNMISGTTEFGYGTTAVKKTDGSRENAYAGGSLTDFTRSLDQLIERAPNLAHISLVVAWHGNDLRIGECQIKPKVDKAAKDTTPYSWQVGPVTRGSAEVVSHIDGFPAAGGAPSDRTIYEAVVAMRSRGIAVTVYPFILMDVPSTNTLPNPYGGIGQPAYPWRGRITCDPAPGQSGTVDQSTAAATQVADFFGTVVAGDFGWDDTNKVVTYTGPATEWSFRRHILHLATIANAASAEDFLIGTEMVGMTKIRSNATTFPAVDQLLLLAAQARSILGANTNISYAADWSEYHSYRPTDGSNDVLFHLDPLWADSNIDYIGIDNYLPISDWRDGDRHLDALEGYQTIYDLDYLRSNVEGGEDYDFFYASQADRDAQVRSPITDGGYGKPWTYQQKNIRDWWGNTHIPRLGGVETGVATAWVPESKPVVFTELGCSASSRGANEPNAFVDTKSVEGRYPRYSLGVRDDLMQRAFLEAVITYWNENNPSSGVYAGEMLDTSRTSLWAWDARPFPDFPRAEDIWSDAPNWEVGHWLNGRLERPDALAGSTGVFRYTDAERPIAYGGFTYEPLPIQPGRVKKQGDLSNNALQIKLPRDGELAQVFRNFRPAHQLTLTVLQGHRTDDAQVYLPRWNGRITASKRKGEEVILSGLPFSTALSRAGLTRNYQLGCPHRLFGPLCRASISAATAVATVASVDTAKVTLQPGWNVHSKDHYVTGFAEWVGKSGQIERRRILNVVGEVLSLSGPATDLGATETISVIVGCQQTSQDCAETHNNLSNCGACPAIPLKNPLGASTNNFY